MSQVRQSASRQRSGLARRIDLPDLGTRFGLLGVWLLVIIVFSVLRPDTFASLQNFQVIFGSQAVLLVITLGLVIPLTAGEFDLSQAGVLNISIVLVGFLNVVHEWPIGLAILVALSAGFVVGLVHAFLVIVLGIQSIVVTLGTGTLLLGLSLGINNVTIPGISPLLVNAVRTDFLGLQLIFWYGLLLTCLVWYVYRFTPLGRYLFFVGAGRDVARLAGIKVDRIRAGALTTSAVAAALAGVLLAGQLGSADPNAGSAYLLPAFAAAFLGSTAITPGRFNPGGAFIAVYFLVTGITGLQLMGLSGWIEDVFYGGSLVLAVSLSQLVATRRVAKSTI